MNSKQYHIPVKPKKLINNLSVVAAVLLGWHMVLFAYHYLVTRVPWYIRDLFDVDEEQSIPTWYSGFILLMATFFLWLVYREKRAQGDPMTVRWLVLFLGFGFLSMDEIVGFHETINSLITPTWAYGGVAISFILLIYFLSFLRSLPKETAVGFLVAGAVYVGGSVGMEFVGSPIYGKTLEYSVATMIEEGMEMFGVILFIRALLRYMDKPSIIVDLGGGAKEPD